MLAWSQTRFFFTLAVAALLVMEPVSWITAPIPGGCLVNPEEYAAYYNGHNDCPTFHVFLVDLTVRVFRHLSDPNWVIADFTVVLAFSTLSLWAVTWRASIRQSRDMEASIDVADRAARAAELSAQASIGLQLPRLVVHAMSMYMPGQPHGTYQPFTTNYRRGAPPEWFQVGVQIDNIGKTNAMVVEHCMETVVGRRLPKIPQYNSVIPAAVGEVIRADDGFLVIHVRNRFFNLTAEQRQATEAEAIELRQSLWVYGFVRFTDFMGNLHEQRFCNRWLVVSFPGGPEPGFISETDTPEEYTKGY
jgi:hypothetical protein